MSPALGFKEEKLIEAFKTICAERSVTEKSLSEKMNISVVTASKILSELEKRRILKSEKGKISKETGRSSRAFSVSKSVSVVIYDLRSRDIKIHLFSPAENHSHTLIFKYKSKRDTATRADYLMLVQNSIIEKHKRRKNILASVYVTDMADSHYDEKQDRIISKSFPELADYTFSQIKGHDENAILLDHSSLLFERLSKSETMSFEKVLILEFDLEKKAAYIFERGQCFSAVDLTELEKTPVFKNISLCDMAKREESLSNALSILFPVFKPDGILISSPYIDSDFCLNIQGRCKFANCRLAFEDLSRVNFEKNVFNFLKEHIKVENLKGKTNEDCNGR